MLYQALNRLERRRILRRHRSLPGDGRQLLRTGGRLRFVEERQRTPRGALEANLDLVVEVAEKANVPYFLVPSTGRRPRVGIPEEHWDALVTAFAECAASRTLVYIAVPAERRSRGRHTTVWWTDLAADDRIVAAARSARTLQVFVPHLNGRYVLKSDWACEVERWDRVDGTRHEAPTHNRFTRLMTVDGARPEQRAFGRMVATLPYFTRPHVFAVGFPVDLVMTWVNGSDPAWLERKRAALVALHRAPDDASASERLYRDNGELRYALRSIERNAAWFRTLYLVTDDQVPDWLDTGNPRLRVVSHRELFAEVGHRHVFNSHAIAARLHHLPGLSDRYIYLNDDIFFARPTTPDLFFHANGVAKFFLSRSTLPSTQAHDAPEHEQARRNSAQLVEREFGVAVTNNFFHAPVAQRGDVLADLEHRFPEVFAQTWRSQFRSADDLEVNGWLHHYWAFCTGRAVPAGIRYDYFRAAADEDTLRRMARLLDRRDYDVFCVNDDDEATEEQRRANVVEYLESYFPTPSSFEKSSSDKRATR